MCKFYVLFEESYDGYCEPVDNKLYTEEQVNNYVKENAKIILDEDTSELFEAFITFESKSGEDGYGPGIFYFKEFTTF